MKTLPPVPGTYALMLWLSRPRSIDVGKLGAIYFSSGWYAYVGSAMGRGGVAARVNRHLRIKKKVHWHIDYLVPATLVTGVFWTSGRQVTEHIWASRLGQKPFSGQLVKGFGCSDCKCDAHLFYYRKRPDSSRVAHHLKAQWIKCDVTVNSPF